MATLQFSEGTDDVPTALHQRKQLLPNIIDGMAKVRPQALYAETPRSPTSYEDGYRKVTYRDLANAVNSLAWMLQKELGYGQNHRTLAYIGPNDLGYVFMILGAVKAGFKLLLVSPRNTVADHIHLFKATDCDALLTPQKPYSTTVTSILEAYPLQIIHSPSIYDLLDSKSPHFPFPKTFAKARNEPLMVVHTSGTTSMPKPIIYTHDFAASYGQFSQLASPAGFESQVSLVQSNRLFVTLPFFHAGCLYATLFDAIQNQTTVITPLTGVMPSAQVIIDGLKHCKADAIVLAPPFMEQIAKQPELLHYITNNVETVTYGGGDVSQHAGKAFTSHVKLFHFPGATETASYPLIRPSGSFPSEDWKYMHPHPMANIKFRPSMEGCFEAVIVRNPDFDDEQPVFKLFHDLKEFSTKDLWTPHPSKPGLWAYGGRVDDIIVFKPGNMCNPINFEQDISRHQAVREALMAGTGRYQPALLVELNSQLDTPEAKEKLVEQLWPAVEAANQKQSLGARIAKSHIIFVDPQKPFLRAGKGTVQRAPTLELYKAEIDQLYENEGDAIAGNEMILPGYEKSFG